MPNKKNYRMVYGLSVLHQRVNHLVNNYYRIYSRLPDFKQLDDMWLAASDGIDDPKIRASLRQVICNGYMRNPQLSDEIGVILAIPKHLDNVI